MRTVDDIVRDEILCCVSGLISDLLTILPQVPNQVLRKTSLDYDELLNLTGTNDWEEPVSDFIDGMTRSALIEALEDLGCMDLDMSDKDLRAKLLDELKEQDELQEFGDANRIEPHFREVYEHWVVTDWLAARLKEKGECVEDVGNLTVWGRTTTGQMISMDWVIGSIHKDLMAS